MLIFKVKWRSPWGPEVHWVEQVGRWSWSLQLLRHGRNPTHTCAPEKKKQYSWAGIFLWMRPANERRRYIVTSSSSLIGWAHPQNDPWLGVIMSLVYHNVINITAMAKAKHKLDESTARRQLKSPQSLSGRSIPIRAPPKKTQHKI